jgi:hypothetical protein
LDRQIARLFALKDPPGVDAERAVDFLDIRPIADQTADSDTAIVDEAA